MKKVLSLFLVFSLVAVALLSLASCTETCQHEWGEEVVSTEATCSRSGVSHVYCEKCGESQRNVISKLPHTYSSKWSFDANNHWYDAICEHTGETYRKGAHTMENGMCTVCGMALVSQGLEYRGNLGTLTYRVTGIGTTLDKDVIVARYYKEYEIVEVDEGAFRNVKGLNSVLLQIYIKRIGDSAFADNEGLTYVEFTSELEYLGSKVIDNCPNFERIIFRGTVAQWNALEKAADWQGDATGFVVDCSDADIQY